MEEEEIRDIFSKNLKFYREKKGLSQMALASAAGLATNFINDIENGKKWVSPATLSKISSALGIQPYKLFMSVNVEMGGSDDLLSQFCQELSNDLMNTMRNVTEKYKGGEKGDR